MDLNLKGAKALITGGTKGIGRAIADTFADEGCNVAICARNAEEVDAAGPGTAVPGPASACLSAATPGRHAARTRTTERKARRTRVVFMRTPG